MHTRAATRDGIHVVWIWTEIHTERRRDPGLQRVCLWPEIHMTPAEGVRTHLDLQGGASGVLLPIHWATFNLAPHPWAEPAEWTRDAAADAGVPVAFPRPGEPFEPAGEVPVAPWWRVACEPVDRPWRRPEAVDAWPPASADRELGGER